MSNTKHLISIIGPTAIGKTNLAIALSKKYSAPILSSDSRQFYREMCIGTAVPSKEELAAAENALLANNVLFNKTKDQKTLPTSNCHNPLLAPPDRLEK